MSQISALTTAVQTESAPVVSLANIRNVTKGKKAADAKMAKLLDKLVQQSEGKWISHDEVKRRLGL